MSYKRYKIVRDSFQGSGETWSLGSGAGYPTKAAAESAARRLNVTAHWPPEKFRVEPMTARDYEIMEDLDK